MNVNLSHFNLLYFLSQEDSTNGLKFTNDQYTLITDVLTYVLYLVKVVVYKIIFIVTRYHCVSNENLNFFKVKYISF